MPDASRRTAAPHLEALALPGDVALAVDLGADVEAVSADVREYGHRQPTRSRQPREPVGPPDCQTVSPRIRRQPEPALVAPARQPAPRQLAVAADNMG